MAAVERRGALNEQCAQMMRTICGVEDDDKGASAEDRNKIRMRHGVKFAAGHANLVRLERHRPVKFPNGLNDHNQIVKAPAVSRKTRMEARQKTSFGQVHWSFGRIVYMIDLPSQLGRFNLAEEIRFFAPVKGILTKERGVPPLCLRLCRAVPSAFFAVKTVLKLHDSPRLQCQVGNATDQPVARALSALRKQRPQGAWRPRRWDEQHRGTARPSRKARCRGR
jgi:hypothetical protein